MARRHNDREPAEATSAEAASTGLLKHHAFLVRWGTSEEIGARIAELRRIASWWASKDVPADDDHAGRGLETALERLATLREVAQEVEFALSEGGYEFDRYLRVLRGTRQSTEGGSARQERAHALLSEAVVDAFEGLKQEGRPGENTRELRMEIRARLANALHPNLLSERTIEAALDAVS